MTLDRARQGPYNLVSVRADTSMIGICFLERQDRRTSKRRESDFVDNTRIDSFSLDFVVLSSRELWFVGGGEVRRSAGSSR